MECVTGSFMNRLTSESTSLSRVAEKSSRCAPAGVLASSSVTSGRKPRSAIWSASSRTVTSMSSSEQMPRSIRSPSRPGVATMTSTPRSQRVDLAVVGHAADGGLEEDAERLAQRQQRVVDLHGQLAGGHQDQRARVLRAGPLAAARSGSAAAGRRRASCRSRSGRGRARPAGQRVRDGGLLDLERGDDAFPGQRPDELAGAGRERRSPRPGLAAAADLRCSRGVSARRVENGRKRAGVSKRGQVGPLVGGPTRASKHPQAFRVHASQDRPWGAEKRRSMNLASVRCVAA